MSDKQSNIEQPTNNNKQISRRGFLGLIGIGTALIYGAGYLLKEGEQDFLDRIGKTDYNGVEIWGVNDPVKNSKEIESLNDFFNRRAISTLPNNLQSVDSEAQSENLLEKNKRYVEFGIRKTEYNYLNNELSKKGINVVDWLQLHTKAMTITFQEAEVPVDLEMVMKRLIILDDNYSNGLFHNPTVGEIPGAIDIDGGYTINDEYKLINPITTVASGVFWEVAHENDKLIFKPPKTVYQQDERKFKYSRDINNLLKNYDGVFLDWGVIHETMHQAINLPDEYTFDINSNSPFRFTKFTTSLSSYMEPYLSPYLSYLSKYYINDKTRGYFSKPNGIYKTTTTVTNSGGIEKVGIYDLLPENIDIETNNQSESFVYVPVLDNGDFRFGAINKYYNDPIFKDVTNITGQGKIRVTNGQLHQVDINNRIYPVDVIYFKNGDKEVFIPTSIFTISKTLGIDKPHYNIEFPDINPNIDLTNRKTQRFIIIKESDITNPQGNVSQIKNDGIIYAKMKIDGTNLYAVWYLPDEINQ